VLVEWLAPKLSQLIDGPRTLFDEPIVISNASNKYIEE
jgi:hypothetical protein